MDGWRNNFIDLHIHSRYSPDGEHEPAMLVEQCRSAGITCMAIADHNTVRGCRRRWRRRCAWGFDVSRRLKSTAAGAVWISRPRLRHRSDLFGIQPAGRRLSGAGACQQCAQARAGQCAWLLPFSRGYGGRVRRRLYGRIVCRGAFEGPAVPVKPAAGALSQRERARRQSLCQLLLGFLCAGQAVLRGDSAPNDGGDRWPDP